MKRFMFALLLLSLQASQPAAPRTFVMPPPAAEVTGPIGWAELEPVFRLPFMCSEHVLGQIPYAGCARRRLLRGRRRRGEEGFSRAYRSDGAANGDWYGWHAEVLAPCDGEVVVGLIGNDVENVPSRLGRPPAATVQIERPDGVLVTLGHITQPRVAVGDRVEAGQSVALVGNNGFGRAPHIHVGAYRRATAEPLQIRWDLRAMARLQPAE